MFRKEASTAAKSGSSAFALNITKENDFVAYNSAPISIITNIDSKKLNRIIKTEIINRDLSFIASYLGDYPHEKLLINKIYI